MSTENISTTEMVNLRVRFKISKEAFKRLQEDMRLRLRTTEGKMIALIIEQRYSTRRILE